MLSVLVAAMLAGASSPDAAVVCKPLVKEVVTRWERDPSPEELMSRYQRRVEYQLEANGIPGPQKQLYRELCWIYFSGAIEGYSNLLDDMERASSRRLASE